LLLDTSILTRTLQEGHPDEQLATRAVTALPKQGAVLCIVPQNLFEFWTVAIRPRGQNGLGMSSARVAVELHRLKRLFKFMPDKAEIYDEWEQLVITHQVSGKPAHDARLVAAMRVHGLTSILTFDRNGFVRYPGIQVVHPADVKP
jgi:predicted nucleic acid-binding protein